MRKLEWLLAGAGGGGGDVLTAGAVGSDHLVATALYAKQAGIRVHAVVGPQPDVPCARVNARLLQATAEKLWVARTRTELPAMWARAWLSIRLFGGVPPAVHPPGGSSPLGALGWVAGGLEIAAQVAQGEMPRPDRVYVALGGGGTAAGLLVGLRLGGLDAEVVAVQVAPALRANAARVRALAHRTRALLGRLGRATPGLGALRVVRDQYGAGYAVPTVAGEAAVPVAAGDGLTLDSTCTAKAFAALLAERATGTSLFIHTANGRSLASALEGALDEVPPSLRGLLRR